jgi:Zn-dependent protease with chaperone function/tetratricopeptide (TPR) repeat protein
MTPSTPRPAPAFIEGPPGYFAALAGMIAGILTLTLSTLRGSPAPADIIVLGAAWFLAAQIIAIPACVRWGGRPLDFLWTGLSCGVLLSLPLLPLLIAPAAPDRRLLAFTLLAWPLFALAIERALGPPAIILSARHGSRELSGEVRTAIAEVISKAGLGLHSAFTVPRAPFDVAVRGIRKCVVAVDRQAIESLGSSGVLALVAREAGHSKLGGGLVRLSACSLAVTAFLSMAVPGWGPDLAWILAVGILFAAWPSFSQTAEFACDRFAAGLTSPADVARAIEILGKEMSPAERRIERSLFLSPFQNRPPAGIRLAALEASEGAPAHLPGSAGGKALALHTASRLLAVIAFFMLPCGALSAVRFLEVPAPTWVQVGALALAAVPLLLGVAGSLLLLRARHEPRGLARLGKREERKVLRIAQEFLDRGRPSEALSVLEAAVSRRASAGVLAGRAEVLIRLGRIPEGRRDIERALRIDRGLRPAIRLLSTAELLLGNGGRARAFGLELTRRAPQEAASWEALGLAAIEAGHAEEARGAFDRALQIAAGSPTALAGAALAALEGKRPAAEAGSRVDRALAAGPDLPLSLLAAARREKERGNGDGAGNLLRKAIDGARRMGEIGWAAHIEELAGGWGILPGAAAE